MDASWLKPPPGCADAPVVATIKARCPSCGVVRLRAPELSVLVDRDALRGAYRFECPGCTAPVVYETTPAICALLVSVGVHEEPMDPDVVPLRMPRPAPHPEHCTAPPFVPGDVEEFRQLLDRDDWFAQLLS
jgi:hypothetical protein